MHFKLLERKADFDTMFTSKVGDMLNRRWEQTYSEDELNGAVIISDYAGYATAVLKFFCVTEE